MEFGLDRNFMYFFMRTYVPCKLLVILSWLSYLFKLNSVPARVTLGVTTVLSITTLMIGLYGNGPQSTSYIKGKLFKEHLLLETNHDL